MKRIVSLLLICFFSVIAVAEDFPEGTFIFEDFSKGLNSHVSVYTVPSNYGTEAQNVRTNSTYKSLDKRKTMPLVVDLGSAAVTGLYRYYKANNDKYLVGAISTTLEYDNDGTAVTIKDGLTDGLEWTFTTYQDVMVGMNGTDNPIKWDGKTQTTADTDESRTADNLCADLGAPFSELNTGANLDASSWYQYKVAFYDGTNYKYITARSNAIQTGATVRDVTLTDIPLGPTGTTHRYIYRTEGNSSKANAEADTSFYQVGAIADNTTTTFNDDVDDATLTADSAPTWATVSAGTDYTPPIGKYCDIAKERLFIAGNTTYPSELYWSEAFKPDIFNPIDLEKIREDDGDKITFLKTFLGIPRIGKTRTIQSFYVDAASDADWYSSDPLSFIGCPAPYSAVVTPLGIAYCSWSGLYLFTGQTSSLFSDAVTPEIEDITPSAMEDTAGVYFNNQYLFAYESLSSGEGLNNRVLVYDFIRDAYVLDTKKIKSFATLNGGDDIGVLYSGSSDTDGYVYAHEDNLPMLRLRYKSEFDAGTYDDMRSYGTENAPELELAWDCDIDGWLAELQSKDAGINTIDDIVTFLPNAIIDRPDTDGTWTSPVYDLGASAFSKLYWNETLGAYGDVTFQLRSGASEAACLAAGWSASVSNPSGSDVSGITAARYVQVRMNFSTTDITFSPNIYSFGGYVFKLTYSEVNSTTEGDFLSLWDSGWKDFQQRGHPKKMHLIRVYYTGDAGTITIRYYNDEGDVDDSFVIDLTVLPTDNAADDYFGVGDEKIYEYYCPLNGGGGDPIGTIWRYTVSDTSTNEWSVQKIEVIYESQDIPGL